MALKISDKKKLITTCIWALLGLLLVIYVVRISLWEKNYYESQEGSERTKPVKVSEDIEIVEPEEVDETEVTEEQRVEYNVPAGNPRYLSIPKLGIYNSRVIRVSKRGDGRLGTPTNIFDVGWYDGSSKPGQGGTMIIDGHNGGPNIEGVFKHIDTLVVGDVIEIAVGGSDVIYKYRVEENVEVKLENADKYMNKEARKSPIEGKESITLITCIGEWSEQQQTYLSRQFVRAVLIN
ncbi:class F sortase [Candidatus Saccharibacteria bacterium]|nr:class F sortase [Candidatus Saccharibacteria bacterium]